MERPLELAVGDGLTDVRQIVVLRRRRWPWLAAAVVVLLTAGAAAGAVATHRLSLHVRVSLPHRAARVRHHVVAHERTPVSPPVVAPALPRVAPTPTRARVTLVARAASWIQVRRTSGIGAVLFEGTLPRGATRSFSGMRLWLRFGWASDVRVAANGRRVRGLAGTTAILVTPYGVRRA